MSRTSCSRPGVRKSMSTLLSGMFILQKPDIHMSPLSLTGTRTPQAQAARRYAGTTWPDRYRGISSMVSHWECRPSVWGHPGRVKAGMPTPRRRCPHAMVHMHANGRGSQAGTKSHLVDTLDLKWARDPTLLVPGGRGWKGGPRERKLPGGEPPPMPQPDTPCQV